MKEVARTLNVRNPSATAALHGKDNLSHEWGLRGFAEGRARISFVRDVLAEIEAENPGLTCTLIFREVPVDAVLKVQRGRILDGEISEKAMKKKLISDSGIPVFIEEKVVKKKGSKRKGSGECSRLTCESLTYFDGILIQVKEGRLVSPEATSLSEEEKVGVLEEGTLETGRSSHGIRSSLTSGEEEKGD